MKKGRAIKCSDTIALRVVDDRAETALELADATGLGRSVINKLIHANLKAGKWEQVWKKSGSRHVPAYRPRK